MNRVAAVLVEGESVVVHVSDPHGIADVFAELGGEAEAEGTYRFSVDRIEDVLTALDRGGFVWAMGGSLIPRTWAQRLFAELPPELHEPAFNALHEVLGSAQDHRAMLESARRDAGR